MYPTKMEANGHIYNINTDYKTAIACFKAIDDTEITDLERYLAIETLLLGTVVNNEDRDILKDKIVWYLRCGKDENTPIGEIDFDYIQDEQDVRTSIRQAYNINLNNVEYLHWWEYNELISGLLPDSLINRIRDTRNLDEKDYKDAKQKERIRKAKEMVAIKKKIKPKKLTDEQQKNMDEFYRLMEAGRSENNGL